MPGTAGHAVVWERVSCFIRTRNCGVCYAASGWENSGLITSQPVLTLGLCLTSQALFFFPKGSSSVRTVVEDDPALTRTDVLTDGPKCVPCGHR